MTSPIDRRLTRLEEAAGCAHGGDIWMIIQIATKNGRGMRAWRRRFNALLTPPGQNPSAQKFGYPTGPAKRRLQRFLGPEERGGPDA